MGIINDYFKGKTRDSSREESLQAVQEKMDIAGSMFDSTVVALGEAIHQIEVATVEGNEEIQRLTQQIEQEKEALETLKKKKASAEKVMSNVKTLFLFEDE